MRKRLGGLACVTAMLAVVLPGIAQADDDIQTLTAGITPTKLDKEKPRSVQLAVDIQTHPNTGASIKSDQPPNASLTVVDFPRNISIDTSKVPRCKVSADQLENTVSEEAIELCGKRSVISVPALSSSHVTVDLDPAMPGSATMPIEVVLTAFNGHDPNTLYFHNRADAVNTTTILREELQKSKAGKAYGTSLITHIPPILAGAPDDFKVAVKKGTIVSAVCKSKRNPFRLTSTFIDWAGGTTGRASTETTCEQKKSGKKPKK